MSRSSSSVPVISLFPFLNVLICFLGVLIMIVLAVTAISLGAGRTVRINIADNDQNLALKPVYMEWDGAQVTLHPGALQVPVEEALAAGGRNGSLFGQTLDRLEESRDKQYVIVAVRPDGFHNFAQFRQTILDRGVRIGYEPIDGSWELSVGRKSREESP